MSIIDLQLNYCASSYSKSTEFFYFLLLNNTLIFQHSNYKNESSEQIALIIKNFYYLFLISRIFVFSISKLSILELFFSDVRAAEISTFIYQKHTLYLFINK